ncbi:UDP-glucose 4-epimerase GalE [Rhodanobacter sp. Si-c]|uniref:UDP-glucose 4-epimerase n=1 Tax=Rhodanobacter lycopersici TaxID=3162487 RepID=A0ABV3QBJ9_9GAMM
MGRTSHILVCGGAGYIGSHLVRHLLERGHRVTVFDNLSTGHRAAVGNADFAEGDLLDSAALGRVFARAPVDAVVHFAALSIVADSVRDPERYRRNNVDGTVNLVRAMRQAGVRRLVFSSSAAVYGNAPGEWIDEEAPKQPINPYGASKAMAEDALADACRDGGLAVASLRYFNAAGAHPSGMIGESHQPETHLIPNVLRIAAGADAGPVQIFGRDYPTADGTCIRDYVHVDDLADAHRRALAWLEGRDGFHPFNLGSGRGFSVLEVLEAACRVAGRPIRSIDAPRRSGDPHRLVASITRAEQMLGWLPLCSDLDTMLETAWRWHRAPRF